MSYIHSSSFIFFPPHLFPGWTIKLHKHRYPLGQRYYSSLISSQQCLTWSRSDRALPALLFGQASSPFSKLRTIWRRRCDLQPGFQQLGRLSHTKLLQPKTCNYFHPQPWIVPPAWAAVVPGGAALCHRVPGEPSPTFSGQMWTVMRERKPLGCLLHHRHPGDLSLAKTVAETSASACFTIR